MRTAVLLFACLVCGGHGRRVQTRIERLQGQPNEEHQKKSLIVGASAQRIGAAVEPSKSERRAGAANALRALTTLLLEFNVPAAGSKVVRQGHSLAVSTLVGTEARSALLVDGHSAHASKLQPDIFMQVTDALEDVEKNMSHSSSESTKEEKLSDLEKVVETLKADVPKMLREEPDWSIFAKDFIVLDDGGVQFEGLKSFSALLTLLRGIYKQLNVRERVEIKYTVPPPDVDEHSSLVVHWKFRIGRVGSLFLNYFRSDTPVVIEVNTIFDFNDENKVDFVMVENRTVNGQDWFWPQVELSEDFASNMKKVRAWVRDVKGYTRQANKLDSIFDAAASRMGVKPASPPDVQQEEIVADTEPPKRRILLMVEPSPFTYVSGYKNRFQALIRYLIEAGDEVLVLTTGPNAPAEFRGAKVVQGPTFQNPFSKQVPQSWVVSPKCWQAVKDFKPHLIHASSPAALSITAALFYKKLLQIPMVVSYHTNLEFYIERYCGVFEPSMKRLYAFLMRLVHRRADLILTTSAQASDDLNKMDLVWSGFSDASLKGDDTMPEPMQVWSKGVDSEVFHPRFSDTDMRSRLTDGQPEAPLIVYVGRLGPEKNLYFIKDIMSELRDKHNLTDVHLAFVGGGPETDGLKEHYKDTPTVLTGPLSGDELSQAYASADVFVMPSESETLGFVVLEAMASQTPVVAVRAGGIPSIIQRDGEVAFLYPPGDVGAAAGHVAALLKDESLRHQTAVAGRKEVSQFDWRAATNKVRQQYSDAERLHEFREKKRAQGR